MDSFVTVEVLRTLTGQVAVTLGLVQMIKSMFTMPNNGIRGVAVVVGIMLNVAVNWVSSGPLGLMAWTLVVVNGFIVAAAAMKSAEMLQGAGPALTASLPRFLAPKKKVVPPAVRRRRARKDASRVIIADPGFVPVKSPPKPPVVPLTTTHKEPTK